ncbi:MAG: ATP-binding protein [Desulfobacterales bacterium]
MKKKVRLLWQLYPSYLILIFVSLLAASLYTSSFIERFFLDRTKKDLLVRGQLFKHQVLQYLSPLDSEKINQLCRKVGRSAKTRFTIVMLDGKVVGDSKEDPAEMDNHKNRPEILSAIDGQFGSAIRNSETLRMQMMYVTLPLVIQKKISAILRISISLTAINETIDSIKARIMIVGLFIALLASAVSLFMSRRISRPIEEMKKGAMRFAEGDLGHRLHEPSISELASLAAVMNRTAFQLDERIQTVRNQRNEYESVLSSMTEGIIGIDREQRIITINRAAVEMLDAKNQTLSGGTIQEVARNSEINRLVAETMENGENREEDVVFFGNEERLLNVQSTVLRNPEGDEIGALLVLNNVTKMRQLENIRRDFAANVSHEIKTPLTAIKGFVETLRFGGDKKPEETERFLLIIEKHVDRLTAIINDLLQLSRIERTGEAEQAEPETCDLEDILQTAIQICGKMAKERNIIVRLSCEAGLRVRVDRTLLEQSVVNLLDNAIKYSGEKSEVSINAKSRGNEIRIEVCDQGIGIEEKHHSRLFERFYRVDTSRSRKLGGTGLGLSIVKHIVLACGGNVSVESKPGKGSTFTIILPA